MVSAAALITRIGPSSRQTLAMIVEVSLERALVGVDCTPLFPLSRNRLLVAARARGAARGHQCRLGGADRRDLDRGVADPLVRSRLGAVFLRVGRLLPDGLPLRRAVTAAGSLAAEMGSPLARRSDDAFRALAVVADRLSRRHLHAVLRAAAWRLRRARHHGPLVPR